MLLVLDHLGFEFGASWFLFWDLLFGCDVMIENDEEGIGVFMNGI